jgi:hypothetical protein
MTIIEKNVYRARVTHCCGQSSLAKDARIKKFWDDLADNWIALEGALVVRDVQGKIIPLV